MKFHRYGHCERIKLKVGDKVKKGDLIAANGTGNGQWYAHCHYDILTYKPAKWTEYCIGKSKEWVKDHYADPRGNEKIVMPTFDHLGLGWLEYWDYASQSKKVDGAKSPCFHPGLDLNGKGSGNADLDDPLYSACDGVVVYVYSGTGKNEGWGDLIVIEEKKEVPPAVEKPVAPAEVPKQDEVVPIPVKVLKAEPVIEKVDPLAGLKKEMEEEYQPKAQKTWVGVLEEILQKLIKLIFNK